MFDPLTITHDEIIKRLHELHQNVVTKEHVAAAFLHSLSTKKVYLRSALSSWALTSELPLHTYEERRAVRPNTSSCGDCNHHRLMADSSYVNEDLNVLNFERIKWGGVRHNWLLYCLMDLELIVKEGEFEVTTEDISILIEMLDAVQSCAPHDGPRQLEKRWKDILPSSKNERDMILEIWSAAGILVQQDTPRKRRGGYSDYHFVAGWQGDDQFSEEAVAFYWGRYMTKGLTKQ